MFIEKENWPSHLSDMMCSFALFANVFYVEL